jgi:tRNA pseudouridine13 synthase
VSARVVHEPPPLSAELPPAGGELGPEPEDFVVDEEPAYPPSGRGEHLWLRIEKTRLTTADAIKHVARAAGVRERDVGSAGMKDKHAVTRQWLSITSEADPASFSLPPGVAVLEHSRHENKLRTGQQRGNQFRIRLVNVPDGGFERASAIADELRAHGLRNYFGGQRFGHGGENLPRALGWLEMGAPMRGKRARFYAKLYASVIQSEVFNRYLTARAELGLDRLIEGDVVRLDGSASVFAVEDPEREQPRLAARDIHLTGPLPGPKTRAAHGRALELENRILGELGLDEQRLSSLARHAPGARRDLVVVPEGLALGPLEGDRLEVEFFLPSGSYATELLRRLTGGPLIAPRLARKPEL